MKRQKGSIIPLTLAALFFLGIGIFFIIGSRIKSTLPGPGVASLDNNLAWKVYSDSRYNFSFSYPASWSFLKNNEYHEPDPLFSYVSLNTPKESSPIARGASIDIFVPDITNLSLRNWFDKNELPDLNKLKNEDGKDFDVDYNYKLSNLEAIKVSGELLAYQYNIYLKNKNIIYSIHSWIGPADTNLLEKKIGQILSTFKFIDKDCPDTCPLYSQPPPGWCKDGKVVAGGINECGCPLPPECTPLDSSDECKIGGCSGELCLDKSAENVASICIYREDFVCYKTAKCEVQASGKCGWTQTAELTNCLKNIPSATQVGQFCGGFAGVACPEGYRCKLDGNYPDAGGKCVKI